MSTGKTLFKPGCYEYAQADANAELKEERETKYT